VDETQKTGALSSRSAATLRMIDANRNRAAEGLRVAEDYCRFALGDRQLTAFCKQLRHELTTALAALPEAALLAARETQQDVGTIVTTTQEGTRTSLASIAAAAWPRVQQALRVIEECLKLSDPQTAATIEALRYRAYTLAKACAVTADSQQRLAAARLYVLVDGANSECAFVERIQSLIKAGVHILQLRDKTLDDRTLLARARLVRHTIGDMAGQEPRPPVPLFIVNDRPDIAVLARADGVHVGQEDLPIHEVRQVVGPNMLIGVSTHSIEQARQAVLDGANYLGCGPTFPSKTKQFDSFPGLEFLREVAEEIALPAFAIGGVTMDQLAGVLGAGFRRIAIASGIHDSDDVQTQVKRLLDGLRYSD
jgi:thiamine-phosphate pyrophosphorylase